MSEALRIMKNQAIAEGVALGKAEGIEQGKAENRKETAQRLLLMGSDNDFISKVTGLSLPEIEKLREQK